MLKLITDILAGDLKAQARQTSVVGVLAALAALLAVAGLAFAIAALRTWLAQRFDAIAADLILCGAFLVVAGAFALSAKLVGSRPPPPAPAAELGDLAPLAMGLVAEWLKSRPAAEARMAAYGGAEADEHEAGLKTGGPGDDAGLKTGGPDIGAGLGGAALAVLPALMIGLLLGRKSKS